MRRLARGLLAAAMALAILPALPAAAQTAPEQSPAFLNIRPDRGSDVSLSSENGDVINMYAWPNYPHLIFIGASSPGSTSGWDLQFGAPVGQKLAPGEYAGARGTSNGAVPQLRVTNCFEGRGRFHVFTADYGVDGALVRFDAAFEYWCDVDTEAFRGEVRIGFGPEPPVQPATPPTPGFLAIREIGAGGELFTNSVSVGDSFRWFLEGGRLRLLTNPMSGPYWHIGLGAGWGQPLLKGKYTNTTESVEAGRPQLWVSGSEISGCYNDAGLFEIHDIGYTPGGELSRIDVSFEIHPCGSTFGYTGRVSYGIAQPPPDPPVIPFPPATVTMKSSDPGEWVGKGESYSYASPGPSSIWWKVDRNAVLDIRVTRGSEYWDIRVAVPVGQTLTTGTYTGAAHTNPYLEPGAVLAVEGNNRGCTQQNSSFIVDEAIYGPYGNLQVFRATFEQRCKEFEGKLTGEIVLGPQQVAISTPHRARVSRSGVVRLDGTVTCESAGQATLVGRVVQGATESGFTKAIACDQAARTWRVATAPGIALRPGTVTVEIDAVAQLETGSFTAGKTRTVRLAPSPR